MTFCVCRGPQAHLFTGVHEQSYIGVVLGYAGCLTDKFGCPLDKMPPRYTSAASTAYSRQDGDGVISQTRRRRSGTADIKQKPTRPPPSSKKYANKAHKSKKSRRLKSQSTTAAAATTTQTARKSQTNPPQSWP